MLDTRPWFRSLPEQVRALLSAPKAAPAFTSRPLDVPEIWQDYLPNPFSWANSLLVHALVLTAMVLPFALKPLIKPVPLPPTTFFDHTPLVLRLPHLTKSADQPRGGGGSGDRTPLPASHGSIPMFSRVQFTPALVHVPQSPLLPMPASVVGPPELKLPAMKLNEPWGDPYSAAVVFSGGPGTGGSFGSGHGPGVGPGEGPGVGPGRDGGWGGQTFQPGFGGVTEPVAIYSPEPAYSEEARKAKFSGTVILWIVVDAQGLVHDVRIAKHLGMGLDEEAVRTVQTWRFKPSTRNGVPVPVQVQVEVSFRLF